MQPLFRGTVFAGILAGAVSPIFSGTYHKAQVLSTANGVTASDPGDPTDLGDLRAFVRIAPDVFAGDLLANTFPITLNAASGTFQLPESGCAPMNGVLLTKFDVYEQPTVDIGFAPGAGRVVGDTFEAPYTAVDLNPHRICCLDADLSSVACGGAHAWQIFYEDAPVGPRSRNATITAQGETGAVKLTPRTEFDGPIRIPPSGTLEIANEFGEVVLEIVTDDDILGMPGIVGHSGASGFGIRSAADYLVITDVDWTAAIEISGGIIDLYGNNVRIQSAGIFKGSGTADFFGAVTDCEISGTTIAVAGAVEGAPCVVGADFDDYDADLEVSCSVTAADTVSVKACCSESVAGLTTACDDPGSTTIKALVGSF